MIRLYKKQIKGIIRVITSEPTRTRPALQTMRIKRDGYAYITNGYIAVRFKLETKPEPKDDMQEEFVITAKNLIQWHALAKSKDYLDELSLCNLHDPNDDTQYPDMGTIFNKNFSEAKSKKEFLIDVDILKQFGDCVGDGQVKVTIIERGVHLRSLLYKNIDGIVMGLER